MSRPTFLVPSIADCVFALALLIVTLVWARPSLNTDGDAGRHIRVGETILERGGLFYEDLFSHTMAGERFVPYEWGSETLTALAHRAGGLPGVVILHGLVVATAWFLLALFLRRRGVDPLLAFLVSVGTAAASAFHWLARPHVFSFVGAILTLWLLETERRNDGRHIRLLSCTIILFAIWANLHGGFLFGLVLIGLYIAADVAEVLFSRPTGKTLPRFHSDLKLNLTLFGGALLGSFINPSGPALLTHVTGYLGKTYLVNMTNEYMSPDFHLWFGRAFLLVLLALLLGVLLSRRRPKWATIVVFLGTLAFSLHSARNIPLFCLTAVPLLAIHLDSDWRSLSWRPVVWLRSALDTGDSRTRAGGWAAGLSCLFLIILLSSGRIAGVPVVIADYDPTIFPVEAVRRARGAKLEGRIFNQFIWGGYILYAWPQQRVFIDGQTDFYGEQLTRIYGAISGGRNDWDDLLSEYKVSIVLVPTESTLGALISADTNWRTWYSDSTATLLLRHE